MYTIVFRRLYKTEGPKFCLVFVSHIFRRGLPGAKKVPFRKWHGCLGELRALFPKECQLLVLTVTATKTTKQNNVQTLHLSEGEMKVIEQSYILPGQN